jgi:hypothetical protein
MWMFKNRVFGNFKAGTENGSIPILSLAADASLWTLFVVGLVNDPKSAI